MNLCSVVHRAGCGERMRKLNEFLAAPESAIILIHMSHVCNGAWVWRLSYVQLFGKGED